MPGEGSLYNFKIKSIEIYCNKDAIMTQLKEQLSTSPRVCGSSPGSPNSWPYTPGHDTEPQTLDALRGQPEFP